MKKLLKRLRDWLLGKRNEAPLHWDVKEPLKTIDDSGAIRHEHEANDWKEEIIPPSPDCKDRTSPPGS